MELVNLDKPLLNFASGPITLGETAITYKLALQEMLGSLPGTDDDTSFHAYTLGMKLGDPITPTCTPADLDLLDIAVKTNAPGFVAIIQGQLVHYLLTLRHP